MTNDVFEKVISPSDPRSGALSVGPGVVNH